MHCGTNNAAVDITAHYLHNSSSDLPQGHSRQLFTYKILSLCVFTGKTLIKHP